jgi:hypothetical protein
MSELSILELETEHAELLPEREALGIFVSVKVVQVANAEAFSIHGFANYNTAVAGNAILIGN